MEEIKIDETDGGISSKFFSPTVTHKEFKLPLYTEENATSEKNLAHKIISSSSN